MRLVFFGQGGRLSTRPLQTLAREFEIVRVVGPKEDSTGGNLERFAESLSAEMVRVSPAELSGELVSGAEVAVAANFPLLLPGALLRKVEAALNLHPSLLPDFRGHSPWLWQFYHQVEQSGWTVHLMDANFDTGPILAQSAFSIPFGIEASELIDQVLQPGSDLLLQTLKQFSAKELQPRPQEGEGRPAPRVEPGAALIDWQTWPTTRVYHFLRGSAPWHRPPAFGGRELRAVAWTNQTLSLRPGETRSMADEVLLGCLDGHILLQSR